MNAYRTTYRPVRDAIALVLFVAITGALAMILATARADAATVTHPSTSTPAQVTCTAFARWQHDQASGSLGRLVTASAALGRSWLKADVLELAATVSSPSAKARKYIPGDRKFVTEDCAKL